MLTLWRQYYLLALNTGTNYSRMHSLERMIIFGRSFKWHLSMVIRFFNLSIKSFLGIKIILSCKSIRIHLIYLPRNLLNYEIRERLADCLQLIVIFSWSNFHLLLILHNKIWLFLLANVKTQGFIVAGKCILLELLPI
jgi:hypothetical protein